MILAVALDPAWSWLWLPLGLAVLVAELVAVFRKGPGDTISEHWYWLRNRAPWLVVPMSGFLLWLLWHFTVDGWAS